MMRWVRGPIAVLAVSAMTGLGTSGPARAQSAADALAGQDDRLTIESKNSDVEELHRLAKEVGRVPGRLLNTVLQRDKVTARPVVAEFLTRNNAAPKRMAARAIALIDQLRGDPRVRTRARMLALASMISDLVAESINAPRVIEIRVHGDYVPPGNARAIDFGPWDGATAPGFEALSPGSDRVAGRREAAYDEGGVSALLADGISGVQRIELRLPNGSYRVVLLAGRSPTRSLPPAPFGRVLVANSNRYHLGEALPRTWIAGSELARPAFGPDHERARLGVARIAEHLSANPGLSPGGDAVGIGFKVDVVHGYLSLRFEQPDPEDGVDLAALIVEPMGQPSSLIRGREVLRASIARGFATGISSRFNADPDMAAALTTVAVDQVPDHAGDIVTSAVRTNPHAAQRIVEVVSHLQGVDAKAIRAAIEDDAVLSRDAKVAALAALPTVRN